MMPANDYFLNKLKQIKNKGLFRTISYLSAPSSAHTIIDNKEVLLFSSNNYLGLCDNPILKAAAVSAIEKWGVGSGGSRLTTGSFDLHRELEERLAAFKKTESSIVFNTGYMANTGTISAVAEKNWIIYCDRLNHASIFDGCNLSGGRLVVYKHCDTNDLLKKVIKFKGVPGLIITDGVFSMDGDIAPLPQIIKIAKEYNLFTMVDDAHATGILGRTGAGSLEYFGLEGKIDIQIGTLSKSMASEGGFAAGSKALIELLRNKAKSFVYSTALAPHTIAVSLAALKIIEEGHELRFCLLKKANWVTAKLNQSGFNVPKETGTPIIPMIIGDTQKALTFSKELLNEGIYIPAIRPPTVPNGTSRLRITLTSSHTQADLEYAVSKLIQVGKQLGILNKES